MKNIINFKKQLTMIKSAVFGLNFRAEARFNEQAFTRDRELPLPILCLLLFKSVKTSTQLEIDDLYEEEAIKKMDKNTPSKQAFSKSRTNLNPEAIRGLFLGGSKSMSKCKGLKFYKNKYRLALMDGSKTKVYNSKELREEYGTANGSERSAAFLNSIAYDPLNNTILDASINHVDASERECAKSHIEAVSKLPLQHRIKNLYLSDRGYPSADFMAFLIDGKHKFLMRVRNKFNVDFDNVKRDEKIKFEYSGKIYSVRVIKVVLPKTGEIETLVTNLNCRDLPYEEAGELYFERWAIETKYNSLKNKLELENMSGRRVVTVQQDFWATLLMANLYASLEWETGKVIEENTADSNNKHEQTTNENRLIHRARKMFIKCLLEDEDDKKKKLFDDLVAYITMRPVEVKPGRSSPRNNPRNSKFHDTYKSVV